MLVSMRLLIEQGKVTAIVRGEVAVRYSQKYWIYLSKVRERFDDI